MAGDYVDPDRMESVYIQSPYICQIFVHGCSLKSSTVAVVVPDEPTVKAWAEQRNIPSLSLSSLCNSKELKVAVSCHHSITIISLPDVHHGGTADPECHISAVSV